MARILFAATMSIAALFPALIPAPGHAATVQVFMSNTRFCNTPVCVVNESITVTRGDTVQWVYADPACTALAALGCLHTVTRTTSPAFNSGAMPGPGGVGTTVTFSRTFTAAGTFGYLCSVHGSMMSASVRVL
ncbi:MAG TPA: hypothetical protein VGB64_11840 [Actinomycetota bacterium]